MVLSDSEPDFDDVEAIGMPPSQELAGKALASKRSRDRTTNSTTRVTKPSQRSTRSVKSGTSHLVLPAVARQILMEKSKSNTILQAGADGKDMDEPDKVALGKAYPNLSSSHEQGRLAGLSRNTGSSGTLYTQNIDREHESTFVSGDEEPKCVEKLGQQETKPAIDAEEQCPADYTNNMDEVATRRRLGELTKKYDSLKARHNDLREVGMIAAERNFERLKKQSEENTAGALKPGAMGHKSAPSEVVLAAQAKEDLYGDLTGLIVRGMKRGDGGSVFDCIQTGRNGTLHFKLSLDAGDASDSYDDVQFTYRPQLDTDRDGDLIRMLPDYLVEEITFPRTQASKFYSRVIKSLTERLN
ncbi:chromosome segregation protein (Pcs1), putative [Metarhizium acridum CQMa 102]|uniref:Chromosome segregation protein (Pcs1), putative n=1 Tax=Metarhizium acridum (strain CQMa 102) TaxID=655827 RepID=E9EDF2_METAQ|nr:chromosome segregation protein (Pcs1), putative [Metarhizium acridum CQMa 102]EFY86092.1 chromosome segregation protein (Pcs1), putative [Metarhizium acridum CQMa 102]